MKSILSRLGVAAMLAVAPVAAVAETQSFHAELSGANEVPRNDSNGKGMLTATYDTVTRKLAWSVTFSGLTGPATGAHFHGPADVRTNMAGIALGKGGAVTSPFKDEALLTAEQASQLQAGRWYFNIHTEKHTGGEIRGQVLMKR